MLSDFTCSRIMGSKVVVLIQYGNGVNLAISLQQPQYGNFAGSTATAFAFAMPSKITFTHFYFSVKHFQMRAAVKYKQTQPVEIISCGIFVDDELGCRSGGNACNE